MPFPEFATIRDLISLIDSKMFALKKLEDKLDNEEAK